MDTGLTHPIHIFQGNRLEGERRKGSEGEGVSIDTWLPLYRWCLSDHSIFIKLSITVCLMIPHASPAHCSAGETQSRLMGALVRRSFLFHHSSWPELAALCPSFCWIRGKRKHERIASTGSFPLPFSRDRLQVSVWERGVFSVLSRVLSLWGSSLPWCSQSACVPLTSANQTQSAGGRLIVREQHDAAAMTLKRWYECLKSRQAALTGELMCGLGRFASPSRSRWWWRSGFTVHHVSF